MSDRFRDGFEEIVSQTPEGPSWDRVSTPLASPEPAPHRRRTGILVGIGAFALTVLVIGVVAFVTTRDGGQSPAADSTTTTTNSASILSEEEQAGIGIWVNGLGLIQTDEGVWRDRYDAMCDQRGWETETALRLGEQYVNADLAAGLSVRDPSAGLPTAEEAAHHVWLMTAQSCRELIPADALETGPPFMDGTEPAPPMLQTFCGRVLLSEDSTPVLPSKALTADAIAALASTDDLGMEGEFFDDVEWFIADDADQTRLVLFGVGQPDENGDPSYADASFEKVDGEWRATGWGGCHIEVTAPGWGGADWVLDPDVPFDPSATEIGILIRERNCANGTPPVDREVRPVVVIEATRVVVHVLVQPVAGGANCQGNPWHPVTLSLSEPLNSRDLYDGREVPPVLVWSEDGALLEPGDR